MLTDFTKGKLSWTCPLRAPDSPGFGRFQSAWRPSGHCGSCDRQIDHSFQVPTETFELQFQPVGFLAHIPHPPITRAALPPAKHLLNLTANRTEQPVGPHRRWPQLLAPAGLAQNPVGHAAFCAPLAAGLA